MIDFHVKIHFEEDSHVADFVAKSLSGWGYQQWIIYREPYGMCFWVLASSKPELFERLGDAFESFND